MNIASVGGGYIVPPYRRTEAARPLRIARYELYTRITLRGGGVW